MSLGIDFYKKLIKICEKPKVKPEDVLLIMTLESGLKPSSVNKDGGASGLMQFMPDSLKRIYKYNPKDYKDKEFKDISGLEQLDIVEKHLNNLSRGRGFKSAAQLYIGNFFPIALFTSGVQAMNPSAVIVEQNPQTQKYKQVAIDYEKKAYNSNKGLDYDKDGKITYGDIDAKMKGASNSKIYKDAIKELNEARSSTSLQDASVEVKTKENMDDNFSKEVDKLLKMVQSNTKFYLIKNSNLAEATEIARAISNGLYKKNINSFILTNFDKVQLKVISSENIKDMIEEDILEDSIDLDYKIASSKFQLMQYRKSLLKGINV